MKKLRDIAHIQMGHTFRSRIVPEVNGGISIIQMRDVASGNRLDDPDKLATVNLTDIHSRHFVKRKDLIFRSRGLTTTAILTDLKQDRVIVAAPLMRLRVTNQNVLPEYLCWYINQPSSQTFLHSRATGSLTVMVGKSILGDLTVPIPSLAAQKDGLTLVALSSQEQHLLADIAIRRKRLVGNTLMRLVTRDEG